MTRCELKLPDDFTDRLNKLGAQTDDIIEECLEAGGQVALAKVKGNLSGVVGRGTKVKSRSSGELHSALGLSPAKPKRDGSGWDVKVGFAEPRHGKGGSNAKIANILEYGRHGQPPKPFLRPAKTASKAGVVEAMKSKFEQLAGDL